MKDSDSCAGLCGTLHGRRFRSVSGAAVCTAADKRKAATGRAELMHLEKVEG